MTTFIAAYCVVLVGVIAFVARLGIRQRRLQHSITALKEKLAGNSISTTAGEQTELLQMPDRTRAA